MANEKNNTNELVSEDDQTAELEAVTFRQGGNGHHSDTSELDENTSDFKRHRSDDAKTIGKLQYDIEQLRAKWIGLETEITAREELTDELNADIENLRESLARKEKLIRTRDRKIKALKSEIRVRDEQHRQSSKELHDELDAMRKAVREVPEPPSIADTAASADADSRLAKTEAYADSLRRKLQDVIALHDNLQLERDRLSGALAETVEKNRHLEEELANAADDKMQLDKELAAIADKHAEELRIVRFELGEAQETVAQSEELNSQLASDLLDTRGFNEELERMLSDTGEHSQRRIEELEKEVTQMTRVVNDYEQKLETRSEAINVLLAELAKKSEQIESINEIGEVISDIDVRISEQFDEEEDDASAHAHKPHDRVTRVLVGKIGSQLLRFPLFKDRLTIGRTDDNDIQLNAIYISRRHAVVQADGDATRVIDWGSKNGVFVNSKRITEHFLKNGDIVTIGNAHFRYEERPKRDA